jgi:hypothetical protein
MTYKFESKRDEIYFKNHLALKLAIESAGGDGDKFMENIADELLNTLARNNIELNPVYLDPNTQSK